jgi:hypothetical protein
MNRMTLRPPNWSWTLSVVVFVLITALWIRSLWALDAVGFRNISHTKSIGVQSCEGEISFVMTHAIHLFNSPGTDYFRLGFSSQAPKLNSLNVLTRTVERTGGFSCRFAGFAFFSFTDKGVVYRCLFVPLWPLILAASIVPLTRRIHPSHTSLGRCPKCGYDLRATPDRCPECGLFKRH